VQRNDDGGDAATTTPEYTVVYVAEHTCTANDSLEAPVILETTTTIVVPAATAASTTTTKGRRPQDDDTDSIVPTTSTTGKRGFADSPGLCRQDGISLSAKTLFADSHQRQSA